MVINGDDMLWQSSWLLTLRRVTWVTFTPSSRMTLAIYCFVDPCVHRYIGAWLAPHKHVADGDIPPRVQGIYLCQVSMYSLNGVGWTSDVGWNDLVHVC